MLGSWLWGCACVWVVVVEEWEVWVIEAVVSGIGASMGSVVLASLQDVQGGVGEALRHLP